MNGSIGGSWPEIETVRKENRRELVLSGDAIKTRLGKEEQIPSAIFTLNSLNFLEISGVGLKSMSSQIEGLSNLSRVVLRGNALTDIPPEFGKLEKLKHLDLSGNELESLPDSLSNLSSLLHFNVSSNRLTQLPDLSEAINLVEVIADHNMIEAFPEWLVGGEEHLIHLSTVNLQRNHIPALPDTLGSLSGGLRTLNLAENRLSQVPGELGDCARLKDLILTGNPLKDRRLLKLVNEKNTKMHAVLDYIRKSCPRTGKGAVDKKGGKNKKRRKGTGKSELEESPENVEGERDEIVVFPSSGQRSIKISPEAAAIRPHLVCCLVRGLDLEKEKAFKSFLQIQNKLHDAEKGCNKRVACTIATHDLSKVKFPLTFTAKEPDAITISPLRTSKEVTGKELVEKLNEEAEALRKKEKRNTYSGIHKYLYLLKDMEKYACLEDSDGRVISFPPITNSEITKMDSGTGELLIEVSGSQDQAVCKRVMEALLTEILSAGIPSSHGDTDQSPKKLLVEQVKVLNNEGKVHVTYPDRNDLKLADVEVKRM